MLRIPDGDDRYDYYYVVVTVYNGVDDPSIHPYEATVTLETNAPDGTMKHLPMHGGDADEPWALPHDDVDRTFTFPAGLVSYREPTTSTAQWTVRGESLLKGRPIFRGDASFLLQVRIDEGSLVNASSTVSVTWYYHSALQAYPVASRTTEIGSP